MTHRLYPETCLERWVRLEREAQRASEERIARHNRIPEAAKRRRRDETRRHHEDEPGRVADSDTSISLPTTYDPSWSDPAPTAQPDPPSTIDPGGGSSGGGGASGDY
jgi:hypothetical protein